MGLTALMPADGHAAVTSPAAGQDVLTGQTLTITWDPDASCTTVDLELYQGSTFMCTIATSVPNDGAHDWVVDGCGADPACNVRIHVVCAGNRETSERFGIGGLLLQDVTAGSRRVDLSWQRLDGDTLGAERLDPEGGNVFGGYNVWRQTYDNQLQADLRDAFVKVRNYEVKSFGQDTLATVWDFPRPQYPIGDQTILQPPDDPIVLNWKLAQTFTTPPDSVLEICQVRVFTGRTFSRWDTVLGIATVTQGVPDEPDSTSFISYGTGSALSGFQWVTFTFDAPVPLDPDRTYALIFTGNPPVAQDGQESGWVYSAYDSHPNGTAWFSSDSGVSWEEDPESDFAFVINAQLAGSTECTDWVGQRRGGDFLRVFNDPESIKAFSRDEEGVLFEFSPAGPFNGFQLRYSVTAYDRWQSSSGNIERPSACEDTLFEASGFPAGIQPNAASVWPEATIPQSSTQRAEPILSKVYPVPNPYVRDVSSVSFPRWELPDELKIQFMNMPSGGKIRIYTVAGDLVRTLEHTTDHGSVNWDLRNESGEVVTSGIYLWLASVDTGQQKTGQLVIVR